MECNNSAIWNSYMIHMSYSNALECLSAHVLWHPYDMLVARRLWHRFDLFMQ